MTGTSAQKFQQSALLVIDVQEALCHGPWHAHEADAMIDRINSVSGAVREGGGTVVFIQHENGDDPLAHGSAGWELAQGLRAHEADLRVRKTTPNSFLRTELESLLQARGILTLLICGLQSECCVDSTTRAALERGYPVTLVSDGHSSFDNTVLRAEQISAHVGLTLSSMSSYGPRVTLQTAAQLVG